MSGKLIPDGYQVDDIVNADAVFTRLEQLAKQKNVPLTVMAEDLGIIPNRLFVIRSRGSIPNVKLLCQFADYFDSTLDYLIAGKIKKDDDELTVFENDVLTRLRKDTEFKSMVKSWMKGTR